MADYTISCCSTVDMPKQYLDERNIPYICFNYNIDGTEYNDDLGQTKTSKEFYDMIRAGAMPTTSQINETDYADFFETILKEGKDILHLSFSSGLSGTVNSARLAADRMMEEYPDRKIVVLDSLAASSGYGLLLDVAVDLKDEGKTLEEVADFIEKNKRKVHHWFFSTNLEHYKRGGRVSGASALVGTVLGICPLLNVDFEGHLITREKIRPKKKVIKEIVNKMKESADNRLEYSGKCFMSTSDSYEDAEEVAKLVRETFPNINGDIKINDIGTIIGSHTGPGTVALFFFGDERVD